MNKTIISIMSVLVLAAPAAAQVVSPSNTGSAGPAAVSGQQIRQESQLRVEAGDKAAGEYQNELLKKQLELREELQKRQQEFLKQAQEQRGELQNLQAEQREQLRIETKTQLVAGFCGGIQGLACPDGYHCALEGDYPDAGGKCVLADTELVKQVRQEFELKRHEAIDELQQKRAEFQNEIRIKREELKNEFEQKRQELRLELRQKVQDERKREAVEKINEQLHELNVRLTNQFMEKVDRMAGILDRVRSRTDKAEANGEDVSSVRAAIAGAEAAIAAAREAVSSQAGKVYAIEITDEATLRNKVGEARQALRADLGNVQKTLQAAHDAVRRAMVALAQIPGVDELEVPDKTEAEKTEDSVSAEATGGQESTGEEDDK